MTDVVCEQLIRRRNRSIDLIYRALICFAIIALVFSTVILGTIGLILAVVLGFAAYYLIFPRFSVEYEYTLINKELDIDIIYGKERRKSGMNLDLSQAELIAPLSSPRMAYYQDCKKNNFSANDPEKPPYAIVITHKQEKVCVLIQMDDTLYSHLRMAVPRVIYRD